MRLDDGAAIREGIHSVTQGHVHCLGLLHQINEAFTARRLQYTLIWAHNLLEIEWATALPWSVCVQFSYQTIESTRWWS